MSGDISVTGVKGEVPVETVSGDITASALASQSSLKTVSGDVMVNAARWTGDLTANSVSGDVTARALKAQGADARTVSGDVALRDASCERAVVQSVSGDMEIGGPLTKGGRYELKSHSGDVRIVVDGRIGFELDAHHVQRGASSRAAPQDGAPTRTGIGPGFSAELQGVFGDGSAQFEVTSFSGNVTIAKAK